MKTTSMSKGATPENYVRVPLEATYTAAWEDVPAQYQATLQGEQVG